MMYFEKRGEKMIISKIGYEKCRSDKRATVLVYNQYTLHYVVSGHGYFNGVKLSAYSGFFIRKNMHVNYSPDPKDPWEYYWITFSSVDDIEEFMRICKIDSNCCFRFNHLKQLQLMYEYYNRLEEINADKYTKSQLADIALSYHKLADETKSNGKPDKYLIDAKGYMLMNCNKKISIREVSESLNITRCYLRDLFMKYEGIPPKVYLNEVKLSCAKELLMNPELSVSLVAKSTGFDDVIAFSRFFKQHTGVSPSEYRKA